MYSAVPPPNKRDESGNNDEEITKSNEKPPPCVSEQTWKKFQELKERRRKCCKTSTDKRIKQIRKEVTKKVFEDMQTPEEVSLLRDFGVNQPKHLKRSVKTDRETRKKRKEPKVSSDLRWSDTNKESYDNADAQVKEREHSLSKEKLEADCNAAVSAGDFQLAEQLNDELVQQDFTSTAAAVLKCKEYLKRKSEELDNGRTKKKKLHWAFEQKHRWESKGNM